MHVRPVLRYAGDITDSGYLRVYDYTHVPVFPHDCKVASRVEGMS